MALPGGAWFSGHVVQGALSDPPYRRTFTAVTTRGPFEGDRFLRHIALSAQKLLQTDPGEEPLKSLTVYLPPSTNKARPSALTEYDVILDDEDELDLRRFPCNKANGEIELRLTFDHEKTSRTRLQAGLVDASIEFRGETESRPGRMYPDPVYRRFHAESFGLHLSRTREKGQTPQLSFLTLQD
nr:hypothetical protein [Planctomycetota bacterium]